MTKLLLPARYSAWLTGDMGNQIHKSLRASFGRLGYTVSLLKLPRAFVVEADCDAEAFKDSAKQALASLEHEIASQYPVFHHQMGPVMTGAIKVV